MSIAASRCCQAAELALKLGRAREAAGLCQHVLAHHRWHLRAHLLLGQAFLEQQDRPRAQQRFRLVLSVDPECAEAHSGLGVIALEQGDVAAAVRALALAFESMPESDEVREALQAALSRQAGRPVPPPAFTPACIGRFYLRRGLPDPAAQSFGAALRREPDRADLRLACAAALWQGGRREQAAELCRPLLQKTPRPLVALLIGAATALAGRWPGEGRRLWAEAHAWDPDDARAQALLGQDCGLPLSPHPAEVPDPSDPALAELLAMASEVDSALAPAAGQAGQELAAYAQETAAGWPALFPGLEPLEPRPPSPVPGEGKEADSMPAPTDPDLRRFQEVLHMVDVRLFGGEAPPPPGPVSVPPTAHGQRPAEVLLAWAEGLRARYGAAEAARIDGLLQELAQAAERRGVVGRVVYLDRPPYADLPAPDPRNADQIKEYLDRLDQRLAAEGLDFHYLTLIGGDDLLPLARLPNPSEDTDETVPSDNLYASRDPTYMIPERATGRLPDGGGPDGSFLLAQLNRCLAGRRGETSAPAASSPGCLGMVLSWFSSLVSGPQGKSAGRRFGLSAQVWEQAAQEVYRLLPGAEALRTCPPLGRDSVSPTWLAGVPLAYFNLHGAAESPNWYGQRDLALGGEGPLMPIAFAPELVPAGQVEGMVIYSEACYGANIIGKDPSTAISLRFLAEGALGFVGSTVVSYGVSIPPLTDADLLGALFWQHLLQGERLGDALLQAKVDFARDMYQRQGYLDGDDMKTLLEFVLYGDPLAPMPNPPGQAATRSAPTSGTRAAGTATTAGQPGRHIPRSTEYANAGIAPAMPVLCGRHAKAVPLHHLSGELVSRVRRSMAWLQQGEQVTGLQAELCGGCPGGLCRGQCQAGEDKAGPEALVFTTRREVRTEDGTAIPQVARVVVDPRGHIIKMAVTR